MRTSIALTLAALAASAVSAVPHRRENTHQHQNVHVARAEPAIPGITVTVTQTVIEPSAIVWVDTAGNTIRTETRAPAFNPTSASNTNTNPPPAMQSAQPAPPSQPTQTTQPAQPPVNTGNTGVNTQAKGATGNGGYGICYDMIDGSTQCKTASRVDQDFAYLAKEGFKMVRTYDIGCDMGIIASKAAAHGMKAFIGINDISNVAGDLAKLISLVNGNWAAIDTVNIGNEKVNHGVAPSVVAAAVNQGRGILRAAGFGGSVVTVEVFNSWTSELAAASDYVAANAHGFFDTSNTAENNGKWLSNTYDGLAKIAGGKEVVITESGWPHAGSVNGAAVPGTAQQSTAITAIKTAFANKQDSVYLFQAYDATYKQPGAMGIEQSFGIYGAD